MKIINRERTKKRALALLGVYHRTKRKIPSFADFVKDYFKVLDPATVNSYAVKQTMLILEEAYKEFQTKNKSKQSITIYI